MIAKYINIDDKYYSSFAYIICEENGKLYSPVYNKRDKIVSFINIDIVHTFLININEYYDLKVGDKRLYAYYYNGKIFTGNKSKLKPLLYELLMDDKIDKPFSMLEIIEFIKIKGYKRNEVLKKCHDYLIKHATPESVAIWEKRVKYRKQYNFIKSTDLNHVINPELDYYKSIKSNIILLPKKITSGYLTRNISIEKVS